MERRKLIEDLLHDPVPPRAVVLHRVSVPLRHALESAHGVERRRESTLVRVELADGVTGWGECVALARPTYSPEYADGAFSVLRDLLAPALLAGEPEALIGHPMATAALEGALLDARLRGRHLSLLDALGGGRPSVPTAAVVGRSATLERLIEEVAGLAERSVSMISVKIAPGWDQVPLAALRSTWPALALAADGNGSYRREDIEHLGQLDSIALHHLEQPLPAGDLVGLSNLRSAIDTPIALDESIVSVASLDTATRVACLDAVNLKPSRVGGLLPALDIIERAEGEGLPVYIGGMLETGVGRAHAAALAAIDEVHWPTHLGPSDRYFETDLTEPFVLDDDGRLVLHTGPGIGVTPEAVRLHEVEVGQVTLRPSSLP